MEQKKELTKHLIADSFKELMYKYPFEKITIKMITDEAGIIRPTFYNHFCDKYELMEWIFEEDIASKMEILLEEEMLVESIKLLFTRIANDSKYYRKAFEVVGQNSFEEVMTNRLCDLLLEAFDNHKVHVDNKVLTNEHLAHYYAMGTVVTIKEWLKRANDDISADEVYDAFMYVLSHSVVDLFE